MLAVVVFWIAALLALAGAVGVVAFREPIRCVLSLVGVMLALSVIFLVLSAQFVFAVQVIVYAGAVMVLFLFVVALLGPIRERTTARLRFHWAFALIAAVPFLIGLWALLGGVRYRPPDATPVAVFGTVQQIGVGLFTSYLYPFELTSILLLVAAIGAIYLSRGDRPPARAGRAAGPPRETPAGRPAEPGREEGSGA